MSVRRPPDPPPWGLVYIAYWGLCEPLGQALVLPAIRRLAEAGVRPLLITFEKPSDLRDPGLARTRALVEKLGVTWSPLRYHKAPQIPAKLFDVLHGAAKALWLTRGFRVDVIHGRTYVGGLIGLLLKVLLRRPFVFHNEGFWPDQQVEAGVWSEGGWAHRGAKLLERVLYQTADGLILLSEHSRAIVEGLPHVREKRTPVAVVPSCVDLDRFRYTDEPGPRPPRRLAYLGSLGGRYLIEPLGRTLQALRDHQPSATLTIASQSDAAMIRSTLSRMGLPDAAFQVLRVPHAEVPRLLHEADAGLFFLRGGPGALSCSPTKVGEYWACGLPVVANAGLGDLDRVIQERGVGVLVEGTDPDYALVVSRLDGLLRDPDLARRCRRAAEDLYGLEGAVVRQLGIYAKVAGGAADAQ